MKILKYKVADRLYQSETGPEAQVGDQVKLFLDTEANPELPEFVFGIIQPGIRRIECNEYTLYTIEYELTEFTLRQDDVISSEVVAAVDVIANDLVLHIQNTANPHQVTKSQVGLNNVDNTSDINKPVSTATQTYVQNQPTVRYTAQSLNVSQQSVARSNIGMPNNTLVNNSGVVAVDWQNGVLNDAAGNASIEWKLRNFLDSSESTVFTWNTNSIEINDFSGVFNIKSTLGSAYFGITLTGSVAEKLSFHGVTPVAQRAGLAQIAVPTTTLTVSNPPTQAEVQAVIDRLALVTTLENEIRATLVQKGLMKGSV